MTPTLPIRVGVVGVGNMGRNHLRVLSTMSQFSLVGLYDVSPTNAQAQAAEYDITAFETYEALCDAVDAVHVVVPSSLHKEYACKAAERNCHVLVEKPIALSVEDADDIIAACEEHGVTLCVGHVERYNPAVIVLSEIVKPEDIIALDFQRLSPYDPRISDADIVHDLMIHDVDVLNGLVPKPIKRLQSQGALIHSQALDYAQALIEFEGGIVASLTASRVTETKVRTARVTCHDKVVTIDYINRTVEISRLTSYKQELGHNTHYRQENTIEKVMVPVKEPLLAEFEEFFRSITEGTAPKTSGKDARTALKICDSITAAATTVAVAE